MTAKEKQQMQRLEIENIRLRELHEKHLNVFRDQLIEIIELKATIELIQGAIDGRP